MLKVGQEIYYMEANILTHEIVLQRANISQIFNENEGEQRFLISTHPCRSCSSNELNMVFSKGGIIYAWGPNIERVKKAVSDSVSCHINQLNFMRHKIFTVS